MLKGALLGIVLFMDTLTDLINDSSANPVDPSAGTGTVGGIVGIILNIMYGSSISIGIIFLIVAAIQYGNSRGDIKKTGTARNAITYSILALIIAMLAFTIKKVVLSSVGVTNTDLLDEQPSF